MKLALRISSYFLGSIMLLGVIILAYDNELDGGTFIGFLIIEIQSILTLIYSYQKK
jgi:hypothetical protein